jgi:glycosyltransferase involved in cell wall biosynthesis
LANSLAESSEVEVVGYKNIFPLWLYPGESKRLSGEIQTRETIRVHEILKYYSVFSARKAAIAIKKKIRPDVVDIQWIAPQHGLVLIPLMFFLKRAGGPKIFLTIHNVSPHESRLFDRFLSRWVFKLADRLLVHAEKLKEEVVHQFGENPQKIAVIPDGICVDGETLPARAQARKRLGIKEKYVILFFGFVRPYKGLDDLILAFRTLVNKFDVALVIAGEFFKGLTECQEELKRQGLWEHTHLFPCYIANEEIPFFFSASDLLVQPYVRFSGQSGVTQTAYLHSLPVVATKVGGLPEIVIDGRTGIIVEPRNPQDLASAIERLLSDDSKRLQYGANGRTFLESTLTWERVSRIRVELYGQA